MMLKIENVSKSFGNKKVVDNISICMDKPEVFGLLGTNGAGKTTTIRMLLGILKKDSGDITWNGKAVDRKKVNFGYLPEERGVYPKVKIIEQLKYFAELKGMSIDDAIESINKWAKLLKVEEYLNMPAEKLSKGNQQKIQFLTAVIHDPELIVLDEPFSGLDPVNTEILKKVIIDLVKEGKYIIMSAHEMHTIEEFCTNVIILNKGKTVLKGNLRSIKESYPANRVLISTNDNISNIIKSLKLELENSVDNSYVIKIKDENDGYKLLDKVIKSNIKVNKFEIEKPTLNDIFIEKVGGKNE
ncbi:MAG: ATP-binding cassette domain-containing protein [Bacilli bacterium]|nr:ATP-binding cassette domain-containing protein [Bacilli bacterium]